MMNPLITVIVPVYNVEKYLGKCVESILSQTYTNLEVFLVDDGSPDNCGAICDEFSRKDARVKVIHKPNGGLSDARNVAIDAMTGDYVTFVDSDDFVSSGYVETLYSLIVRCEVGMAVSQFKHYKEGDAERIVQSDLREMVLDWREATSTMFYQRLFDTSACVKMYKKDLFSAGIRYPKGLLYEDLATTYKLIAKAGKVAVTNRQMYYYFLRDDSIIGRSFNPRKLDLFWIADTMLQEFGTGEPELFRALKCRLVSSYFNVFLQIAPGDFHEQLFWQRIIPFRKEVLADRKARLKTRLACLLSFLGISAVRFIFHFINRRK